MNWIDVRERLPPQDVYVLINVYDGRPKMQMSSVRIANRMGNSWFSDHDGSDVCKKYGIVTHWMVLPDPAEVN